MQRRYDWTDHDRQRSQKQERRARRNAVRLCACVILLGLTVFMRSFMPDTTERVRAMVLPMIEEEHNIRAAISTFGETISGEGSVIAAFGEMYTVAFRGEQSTYEVQISAPKTNEAPSVPKEYAPNLEAIFGLEAPEETEEKTEEPAQETEAAPETPEAVAAFFAHQAQFDAFTLPDNVSLAYYPLGIAVAAPAQGRVSSPFGFRVHPLRGETRFHFGTDLALYHGVPFYAFADGVVMRAGEDEGFGKYILLDHGDGIITRYAHASHQYVQTGDTVTIGQRIGRVGQTGSATGPHLHFELMVNGLFRNPAFYVNFQY